MPRRILLLITDLEIGGTPTVVRELGVRLRSVGRAEVEVACLSRWGPVADQLTAAGVSVTALNGSGTIDLPKVLNRLVRLIRRGCFDTVFSFLVHANAVAAAALMFRPEVRFLQSIQTTQPQPRWHWRLQGVIHPAADAIVVPSASAARVAQEWAGVPAGKLVVIPNAVDVPSFDEIYRGRRAPTQSPGIGFVGRLDPIKRVPDLVEAMNQMPSARLHIFGEGSDRPRIEAAIARYGLDGRATLHGAVPRPHIALADIDVLVLPSEAEGFGLVLIEAMAAGVPVVASNVPGIRDVVRHGWNGLLFDKGDVNALARAVGHALDPNWRAEVIPRARAEVERQYSWQGVMQAYRALLKLD